VLVVGFVGGEWVIWGLVVILRFDCVCIVVFVVTIRIDPSEIAKGQPFPPSNYWPSEK